MVSQVFRVIWNTAQVIQYVFLRYKIGKFNAGGNYSLNIIVGREITATNDTMRFVFITWQINPAIVIGRYFTENAGGAVRL